MKIEFNWHLPMAGDGRAICTRQPDRMPTAAHIGQIARAAEQLGFDRLLVPCAFSSHTYGLSAPYLDGYTMGIHALGLTSRIEILIAHRPGFVNPGVFAQMCATADRMGEGRLALNIVTAGAPGDMEQFGDILDHGSRYRRAEEFVTILRRLWNSDRIDFDGEFYRMNDARIEPKPCRLTGPPIHLVGASEAALGMASRQADVYLMSAEPVERIATRIRDLRRLAGTRGPDIRFGVAGTVFCRASREEARGLARTFVDRADLSVLGERLAAGRITTSVEDLRARAGTNIETWLTPTLWSGLAHLAYGAAWVGSYADIADLFEEYVAAGVSVFQLYGYPFLEEAYNVGENLLPEVKRRLGSAD